ncbi:MFS transporter [Piscinibacter sp.]|uniref:MFS transporter n=1 Tax=Piscinibacter sp. TaxID=1903157 RepID=UPI002C2C5358|nr:MFS transporter [Albitalea sp.]HUG25882.1 MFS transporter [Albitalea sp.]
MPRLLYLLALCNLVIGTGAFVISGLLVPVAQSLEVSVAQAGQTMTAYALATAVLAPLALVLTGHWPRKRALCTGMAVFALGNALCATASDFSLLLIGRVMMGAGAMFTALAAGIAVALVDAERRGRALSLTFLGISLSYVIGLPLGAWLGFRFGWRWPVGLVATLAGASVVALIVLLPKDIAAPGASFRGLGALLTQRAVQWTLGLTLLYFTAIFLVFSYIGPVLQALVPMSAERLSVTLMLFGLSGVAGTLLGGWANDRFGPRPTLVVQLALLGTMMALLPLTRGHYPLLVATLVTWGVAGFGMMAPQQSRLAVLAPAHAPILLSLNTSMLYLGTALGAAIGGAVSGQVGFAQMAWIGVPFALAGMATLWINPRKPGLLAQT